MAGARMQQTRDSPPSYSAIEALLLFRLNIPHRKIFADQWMHTPLSGRAFISGAQANLSFGHLASQASDLNAMPSSRWRKSP
jgi:hypothetical protein